VVKCFPDDSVDKTVDFITEVLDKGANGTLGELISLIDSIKEFSDSLPESISTCL